MPETRYIEEYKDGVLIKQISYEVTDEELAREQAEIDLEEFLGLADGAITVPTIGKYLKALARLRR